jgi:hypothetical protein
MRTTMICTGPPDQSFLSSLFQIFDQLRLVPVNFISIRLEDAIWAKFQIEGSWANVVRLRARVLGLDGAGLYSSRQLESLCVGQAIVDGIRSLGLAAGIQDRSERRAQAFRGLQ